MGRAPLHTVAEQAQSFVMHQLGSSLHMISRKKKSTGRPRKVTSRDERNIIRVVSNSPKSLNDVRAELNLSVRKQTVHNAITRNGTIVRQNITKNYMKRRSQLVHHETLCLLRNGPVPEPKTPKYHLPTLEESHPLAEFYGGLGDEELPANPIRRMIASWSLDSIQRGRDMTVAGITENQVIIKIPFQKSLTRVGPIHAQSQQGECHGDVHNFNAKSMISTDK
uniref:Transposable element Tc3 transposase-like DNA-binding HTH domain-containing protein n=1 Tax=Caenorhabditis japonica TaxID=281687 RepID=A0A8R1I9A5_CAEJA